MHIHRTFRIPSALKGFIFHFSIIPRRRSWILFRRQTRFFAAIAVSALRFLDLQSGFRHGCGADRGSGSGAACRLQEHCKGMTDAVGLQDFSIASFVSTLSG
jgi:hypothetical protein